MDPTTRMPKRISRPLENWLEDGVKEVLIVWWHTEPWDYLLTLTLCEGRIARVLSEFQGYDSNILVRLACRLSIVRRARGRVRGFEGSQELSAFCFQLQFSRTGRSGKRSLVKSICVIFWSHAIRGN